MEPIPPYPVSVTIQPQEKYSRLLALCTLLLTIPKLFILIPHFIVVHVLTFVAFILMVIAQFAVLFTGRYPQTLFEFNLGVIRWSVRVKSYLAGLTDTYPPFRMRE